MNEVSLLKVHLPRSAMELGLPVSCRARIER
jgi:hypothetical protein